MMNVTWIVQQNLGNANDIDALKAACEAGGYPFRGICAIPFSTQAPSISEPGPLVFYGSTNLIQNFYRNDPKSSGIFFDETSFRFSSWRRHYGSSLLNAEADVLTMAAFAAQPHSPETCFFVRPDKDLKEFAGAVMSFGEFQAWCQRLVAGDCLLQLDTQILAGPPIPILREWRVFIVEGEISTCSLYRVEGQLRTKRELPSRVARFVSEMTELWQPAPVFVMDVAETPERLAVIEINGFNSSGFYACDVEKLVHDVSACVRKRAAKQ